MCLACAVMTRVGIASSSCHEDARSQRTHFLDSEDACSTIFGLSAVLSGIASGSQDDQSAGSQFECYGYEAWTLLFPNHFVEITDVFEIRKEALEHNKSQLGDKDCIHSSLGLNGYRNSVWLDNRSGFAEAFFKASLKE